VIIVHVRKALAGFQRQREAHVAHVQSFLDVSRDTVFPAAEMTRFLCFIIYARKAYSELPRAVSSAK